MKKIKCILSTLAAASALAAALAFTACDFGGHKGGNTEGGSDQTQTTPSFPENPVASMEGLAYKLSGNGTYYIVSGMGTCTATDIVIANTYNNLPVTSIDNSAFWGCSGLTSITIPNSVTYIDNFAFLGCSGLTSITIPNFVTYIGDQAFEHCSGLTIYCEATEKPSGWSSNWSSSCPVVWDCRNNDKDEDGYAYSVIDGIRYSLKKGIAAVISQPRNIGEDVNIPDSITYEGSSFSVTSIWTRAFSNYSKLTSITIPNSVTSIGWNAFEYCNSLTSITIPNSVTSIGDSAFRYCNSLTIYCEATQEPIGLDSDWNDSFCPVVWDCKNNDKDKDGYAYSVIDGIRYSLKEGIATVISQPRNIGEDVNIPDSITYKGSSFSVTSIADYAFEGCSELTSITVPDSVTSIGWNAFNGTAWYKNQPDGLVYAGKVAYDYKGTMPSNTSITLNEGTKGIANYAFYNCSGLTSVTIPDSVTSIGTWAFSGTAWYKNQPDGLVYAGKVAYDYKGTMPSNTSITLNEGTKGIADCAFWYCSELTSIIIPNSVTYIGNYAFWGCSSLTSIQFNGTKAEWQAIKKDNYWNSDTGNFTVTCTDGTLDKNGNEIA